jgi:hypothetical protein
MYVHTYKTGAGFIYEFLANYQHSSKAVKIPLLCRWINIVALNLSSLQRYTRLILKCITKRINIIYKQYFYMVNSESSVSQIIRHIL